MLHFYTGYTELIPIPINVSIIGFGSLEGATALDEG